MTIKKNGEAKPAFQLKSRQELLNELVKAHLKLQEQAEVIASLKKVIEEAAADADAQAKEAAKWKERYEKYAEVHTVVSG